MNKISSILLGGITLTLVILGIWIASLTFPEAMGIEDTQLKPQGNLKELISEIDSTTAAPWRLGIRGNLKFKINSQYKRGNLNAEGRTALLEYMDRKYLGQLNREADRILTSAANTKPMKAVLAELAIFKGTKLKDDPRISSVRAKEKFLREVFHNFGKAKRFTKEDEYSGERRAEIIKEMRLFQSNPHSRQNRNLQKIYEDRKQEMKDHRDYHERFISCSSDEGFCLCGEFPSQSYYFKKCIEFNNRKP